jgi:hypothetical protein
VPKIEREIKIKQPRRKPIFETKGSHVRMRNRASPSHKPLSVPGHKEIKARFI